MTSVLVYGAYGLTGRFVVAELRERGFTPVLSGRDAAKLPGGRPASVDDPAALDRALDGVAAVINCAGPFAATALPLASAAIRAGIPYVDVAAEIEANLDTFALAADTAVVPAMAFFGGLGDLLATAAMGDWPSAGEVHVAYGLSGWHPTPGTLAAGQVSRERRGGKRVRCAGGRLEHRDDALPSLEWSFPEPLGTRPVLGEFSMADIVTIPRHLAVPSVTSYMTVDAAQGLAAAAERDAAETFVVDVRVRRDDEERRAVAHGQDIYAVSAPLAVEAVERILTGRARVKGVASAGEIFDAPDFLRALAPHITVEFS
ncbi:saccharopine dehydrogenase NADP-binding domain-containing protein [Amycolatopsis sp. FBCC-B4732]|uniref:saccharopine dehydrogenase NADP-binding domain-containing protein n=1 Tax=Amycolatopsis sp. FBCC-B4732 TaxID=3079339 RepID=UPI001FF48AEF|nr:saccharopine dehydrogenase NADP-binding domain-containing protein [Amycolatopsis sp. FBCC-B4732]UOX88896.1 saccharopine dehydrogenase NADP-binding domain-containing protein [Amycolatopsis sp. FBCC-B4732]